MNIAVNARVLLTSRMEGVCRYIYETTKRMVLNHPEDKFYFFFDRPFDSTLIFADNVYPIIIPPPARAPILWKIWFDYSIPYYLKKYNIDFFYSGDTYLSLKTEVPTLLVSHDLAYLHFPEHIPKRKLKYYQKYFPLFHKRADHIVSVSQLTKDDIIKQYNISPHKISVAYNAVPSGFYQLDADAKETVRKEYTDGSRFLLYVGSIHPRKNIERLIKAYDIFRDNSSEQIKLLLIGRKAWKYDLIDAAYNDSKYRDDIRFLGSVGDEMKIIMASAECLIYISLFEGFGIPVLEGFSAHVPVITSKGTSMEEVSGSAAKLVDPYNTQEIAKGIDDIIKDDKLKSEMVQAGKERLKHFSWDATSEHIYDRLQDLK